MRVGDGGGWSWVVGGGGWSWVAGGGCGGGGHVVVVVEGLLWTVNLILNLWAVVLRQENDIVSSFQ